MSARASQTTAPRASHPRLVALALVPLLLLDATPGAGAPATRTEGPAALVFAPDAGFFDVPFPLDARRRDDGELDLAGFPNPQRVGFVRRAIEACAGRCRGFSPATSVYLRFDAPVELAIDDPRRSLEPGAAAFVVDVDPWSAGFLQRHPVRVQTTARADSVRPAYLVQLAPPAGLWLRPDTTYAAVVRRDRATTPTLGRCAALESLLRGELPAGLDAATALRLRRAYAPLAAALPRLGLRPEAIAAATVFTTEDPTTLLRAQVDWVRRQPALVPQRLEVVARRSDHSVLRGVVEMPLYQDGWPPYLALGGAQILDANGHPVAQDHAEIAFELAVPHRPMPAAGFPLYFYVHGTGGEAHQLSTRGYRLAADQPSQSGTTLADLAAREGWAASCVDGPYSPNRIGLRALDGYAAYNFFRPAVLRDNVLQMVLEQVHFLDLVRGLRIDGALLPGVALDPRGDGQVRFDVEHMVVGGQSLGSYLAGMLAALTDDFRAAILTGAGGSWIEFAFGPKDPLDLQAALEALTLAGDERYDRFHPFLTLFEMAAGPADNTFYLPAILRRPAFGRRPPHVLVIEGHVDLQVPTNLQRALVLGLGVDLLGRDVGATPDARLEPVLPWAGLAHLQGSARGNRLLPGGQARTAVVVRYPEDGILEGHYVAYQWQAPRAQIAALLRAIAADQMPEVVDFSERVGERPR